MVAKLINVQELRRQYELEPGRCVTQLMENMSSGKLKPENFSVRDLFVALTPNGRELLYEISFARSGGNQRALQEAAGAVQASDFTQITGQLFINKVKEAYTNPTLLWPELVTVVPTEFLNGERIPGIGPINPSGVEAVAESAEYPRLGLNQNWLDTKNTVKHGFIIEFTRESIVADRTGIMLKQAGDGARAAGVATEKEVIDVATGQVQGYNRNGVFTNTYLTTGAYVNVNNTATGVSNALDGSANEWRALEKADLLFDAMVDPNTNEPIGIPPTVQLLCPSALLKTAERIVHATDVQTVDMRANATTIRTNSGNPLGTRKPQILSNQYVKARTGSTSQWFYGSFKDAIFWMQVWAIEAMQAASNNEVEFTRDVWSRHKVSYRGVAQMYEPRFLTKNDV